jgi:hypothetical protein
MSEEQNTAAPVERAVKPKIEGWLSPESEVSESLAYSNHEMVDLCREEYTPLHLIPEGWAQEIENLFGEYWDCAYQEGRLGRSDGDKANDILHRLRKMLPDSE